MILVNGSKAVICSELIISNIGCIDTPKINENHALEAIIAMNELSAASTVAIYTGTGIY